MIFYKIEHIGVKKETVQQWVNNGIINVRIGKTAGLMSTPGKATDTCTLHDNKLRMKQEYQNETKVSSLI